MNAIRICVGIARALWRAACKPADVVARSLHAIRYARRSRQDSWLGGLQQSVPVISTQTFKSASPLATPMSVRFWLIVLPLLAFSVSILPAQGKKDPELQRIYKQMDEREKTFRSFTAKVSQKEYTAVLKEFTIPERGEFYYKRAKDGTALLRLEFTSPGKKILTIKNSVATVYQPDINEAQIKNLGKDQDLAEYLAIGLSQSPAKLEKSFDISYKGSETVNGASCDILIFKPKLSSIAKYFSSMTVWYKKSDGIPIQNKKEEPNGNYVLMNFSDEKLNVNVPNSKFDQKLNGVKIQEF
jgi:outer membrane lipoprotein-sorting protein